MSSAPPPAPAPITPQQAADIYGSTGAHFMIKVDSGTLSDPSLPGSTVNLVDTQTMEVVSLPAGNSTLTFAIVFAPGDPPANISVSTPAISGTATANPGRTLIPTILAPAINLYGS